MRSSSRYRRAARGVLTGALAAMAGSVILAAGAAQAQSPSPAPAGVIDGPSSAIMGLNGMSVARDGTGGLVYVKTVGGVPHVFVSVLAGAFQAPQQVDVGLGGASSQPVIAAGTGGLLLVAFVNGGTLYVADRAGSGAAFTAPSPLAGGASNPAISITTIGKAYLAFTATGGGGHDVRCAYYVGGTWAVEPSPLDAAPGDDAGTGPGRPAVAASGDGVAIVAWGEAGHVFTRRVWGTSPSVVYEQADPPSLGGWTEVAADEPAVATGGDSSYVAVAFHETFSSGANQQSRVFMRRLRGSLFDGVTQADDLTTPGAEGADQPQIAVGEYGQGFVTSGRDTSHDVLAQQLNSNDIPGSVQRLDSLENLGMPYAVPAVAGYHSALVAWQETPAVGSSEIRTRFYDGKTFNSEIPVSAAAMGPTDAASGLVADGDIASDVAVAWVQDQGVGGPPAIVATLMYVPPGSFGPIQTAHYLRSLTPTLTWSAAREFWGPLRYTVTLDGTQIGQTAGTSVRPPPARYPLGLSQGSHRWGVMATNAVGQSTGDHTASFFVDTIAPQLHTKLSRKRTLGSTLHLTVRDTDTPPGLTRSQASGIAEVLVKWGDGKRARYGTRAGKSHVYAKAKTYKLTVVATDRAGNTTQVVLRVTIKKPKPPKKHTSTHAKH
jgi:hypothetical protein